MRSKVLTASIFTALLVGGLLFMFAGVDHSRPRPIGPLVVSSESPTSSVRVGLVAHTLGEPVDVYGGNLGTMATYTLSLPDPANPHEHVPDGNWGLVLDQIEKAGGTFIPGRLTAITRNGVRVDQRDDYPTSAHPDWIDFSGRLLPGEHRHGLVLFSYATTDPIVTVYLLDGVSDPIVKWSVS